MDDPAAFAGLEPMSEQECWELLGKGVVGRLAVAIDGHPDVFPVNYVVDDSTIVIRSAPGTKLAAAVLGRGVAFEIDETDAEHRVGWSVVVHGKAHEVERLDEMVAVADLPVEPWAPGLKGHFIRIEPSKVTGRRLSAG